MNSLIIDFIKDQSCASICYIDLVGKPQCFNCMYGFDFENNYLLFKSSNDSYHSKNITPNSLIAGTILPNKLMPFQNIGIQFNGITLSTDQNLKERINTNYYIKSPLSIAIPGKIWLIQLNKIKMTGKLKGFGQKITWERSTN